MYVEYKDILHIVDNSYNTVTVACDYYFIVQCLQGFFLHPGWNDVARCHWTVGEGGGVELQKMYFTYYACQDR